MSPVVDRQVLFQILQQEHQNVQNALMHGTIYSNQMSNGLFSGTGNLDTKVNVISENNHQNSS